MAILLNLALSLTLFLALWLLLVMFMLFVVYGRDIRRLWKEPMLRYPVVIFESDDWGVGPQEQVPALTELLQLFQGYRDRQQRHPVLTLGLILAEPDPQKIIEQNSYCYRDLSHAEYAELVQLIKQGQPSVFALHLHGMEHFWPPSLMNRLQMKEVKQWLFENADHKTENLPSFLQSRWCDTSSLPSKPISEQAIAKAIAKELQCFERVFAQKPRVVVPPTFVWTDAVIEKYIKHAVKIYITPGRQFTGRNANGELQSNGRTFYNGECDHNTACYLVRDIYFEPQKGHKSEQVMRDILKHHHCGRPALIEMHRFNFLEDKAASLQELKQLLDAVSTQFSHVMYLNVEELMAAYCSNNKELILLNSLPRLRVWLHRLQEYFKYKRLARYSGFNGLLKGVTRLMPALSGREGV